MNNVPERIKNLRGDEYRNLLFLKVIDRNGTVLNKNGYIQYKKEQEQTRKKMEEQMKKYQEERPALMTALKARLNAGEAIPEGELMQFPELLESLNRSQYNINNSNPVMWPIWKKKKGGKQTRKQRKARKSKATRKH